MFTDTLSVVMNEPSRLQFAAEIFTSFLPYLTNFCYQKKAYLQSIQSLQFASNPSKMYHLTAAQHDIQSKRLNSVLLIDFF